VTSRFLRVGLIAGVIGAAMALTAILAMADQPGEKARGSGSIYTYEDFSFQATGDQNNSGAAGRVKVTYPGSDPNQQYAGDIDCLVVVSGNRAIMSGPITNVQPAGDPYYEPDRFILYAEDNGPNGGSSSNPDRVGFSAFNSSFYYPPVDCNNPSYFLYGQPITKGDVDVSP
jgi:hypothetical protein